MSEVFDQDWATEVNDIIKVINGELVDGTEIVIGDELKKLINSSKEIISQLKNYNSSKGAYLQKGYYLMMKLRELFTNEVIDYRVYHNIGGGAITEVEVFDIDEYYLVDKALWTEKGLSLGSFYRELTSAIEEESYAKSYVALIHEKITNRFIPLLLDNTKDHSEKSKVLQYLTAKENHTQSRNQSGYVAHSIYHNKNEYTAILSSKQDNRYQFYNRGWVYQAFDIATSNTYKNYLQQTNTAKQSAILEKDPFKITDIRKEKYINNFILKGLVRENNPAISGGDNGLTQIKSDNAGLIKAAQVRIVLEHFIDNILVPISNGTATQYSIEKALKSKIQIGNLKTNIKSRLTHEAKTHIEELLNEL